MASYRTCPRYYPNTHSDQIGDDWTKASKVIELTTYWTPDARPPARQYAAGKTIIRYKNISEALMQI